MIKKIKNFFKKLRQKWIIRREFLKFASSNEELPLGEQFAFKTFDIVELLWNGKKLQFVIGNINVLDLVFCGRYPNIYFTYLNSLLREKGELNDENIKDVDIEKLQEEECVFFEELCKKTMIKPSYNELHDSMVKVKKEYIQGYEPKNIKEVFPSDFLIALQTHHFNKLFNLVKKNSGG